MTTQLFLAEFANRAAYLYSTERYTNLLGTTLNYWRCELSTTRGASVVTYTAASVNGPTAGLEAVTAPRLFISPPLAAAVTISGSITFNLRGSEAAMTANAAIQARILKIPAATGVFAEVYKSTQATEIGTVETVQNWSATPGSSFSFSRGDRIVVSMFMIDGGGTMASGSNLSFFYNGASGATGDSWIQFTETFSFESTPASTSVYPTNTSAGINPGAATELEAWTSRGGGVQTTTTNTSGGPVSPIQVTATAGGTAVEWYTKQLQATTLSGAVLVNARTKWSSDSANATLRCEIALTASDGSGASVWGVGSGGTQGTTTFRYVGLSTTETATQFFVGGDNLSITDGQRLRVRFFVDDSTGAFSTLAASFNVTLYYAGSASATGDTFLTFPITLTEYVASGGGDDVMPYFGGGYYP